MEVFVLFGVVEGRLVESSREHLHLGTVHTKTTAQLGAGKQVVKRVVILRDIQDDLQETTTGTIIATSGWSVLLIRQTAAIPLITESTQA